MNIADQHALNISEENIAAPYYTASVLTAWGAILYRQVYILNGNIIVLCI